MRWLEIVAYLAGEKPKFGGLALNGCHTHCIKYCTSSHCKIQDRQSANLQEYEVALVTPLHDFKNMINRVISELPHMATKAL